MKLQENENIQVNQYQLLKWPTIEDERGADQILLFLTELRKDSYLQKAYLSPVLIHCG